MVKPIPGPDPNPRTPAFKLPPLACDAHTHIFGPGDKYPYAPDRSYTPPDAPLSAFQALHRKLGIGRAVIVNATVHGTDNRVALDAIAVSDGRYRGVANIDGSITEQGVRALHDGGFRGCRFNFVRHLGGMPDMARSIASSRWWRRSTGTSTCISMRSTCPTSRTCWRSCRCATRSTIWRASRRPTGSNSGRSRSCSS